MSLIACPVCGEFVVADFDRYTAPRWHCENCGATSTNMTLTTTTQTYPIISKEAEPNE